MLISELQDKIHRKYLRLQKLKRYLSSVQFIMAYQNGNKEKFLQLIEAEDLDGIKILTERFIAQNHLDMLSIGALRELGKQKRIPGYWCMFKDQLIERLKNDHSN